ncbi:MAG: hypothetical protein ACC662_07820, partial [Planctomycetota bacterium]
PIQIFETLRQLPLIAFDHLLLLAQLIGTLHLLIVAFVERQLALRFRAEPSAVGLLRHGRARLAGAVRRVERHLREEREAVRTFWENPSAGWLAAPRAGLGTATVAVGPA